MSETEECKVETGGNDFETVAPVEPASKRPVGVFKKNRRGNPNWHKGMKPAYNSTEKKRKTNEALKQIGKDFPAQCRFYMNEKGFKNAQAIADDRDHPRRLDAIKFLASYGFGLPKETIRVDSPGELKKETQERLADVLPFLREQGGTSSGLPEGLENPESVAAGGVQASDPQGSVS